jgi:hypothetical protein
LNRVSGQISAFPFSWPPWTAARAENALSERATLQKRNIFQEMPAYPKPLAKIAPKKIFQHFR